MYNYTLFNSDQCEFIEIGPATELENGGRWFIEIDTLSLVVFNIGGQYFAIADLCSHDDGPLGDGDLEGYEVICPRHGARFDVKTGKVHSLPAVDDIPAYPVRVVDDKLEIGIPQG